MPFKSASSKITLAAAAAFALSSTAMAQTMVGDQEVSEADMPMVEAHCATLTGDLAADDTMDDTATDDLAADDTFDDTATDDMAADDPVGDTATDDLAADDPVDDMATGATDPADDPATDDLAADDPVGDTATDDLAADDTMDDEMVDLAAITAEDCEAAGIGTE